MPLNCTALVIRPKNEEGFKVFTRNKSKTLECLYRYTFLRNSRDTKMPMRSSSGAPSVHLWHRAQGCAYLFPTLVKRRCFHIISLRSWPAFVLRAGACASILYRASRSHREIRTSFCKLQRQLSRIRLTLWYPFYDPKHEDSDRSTDVLSNIRSEVCVRNNCKVIGCMVNLVTPRENHTVDLTRHLFEKFKLSSQGRGQG
jgi:hypothetical protein